MGLRLVACVGPVHAALAQGCCLGCPRQGCIHKANAGSNVGPTTLAEADAELFLHQPNLACTGAVLGGEREFSGGRCASPGMRVRLGRGC